MLYNDGLKPHLSVLFLVHAPMVKLVNTADLKSAALGLTGASPVGSIVSPMANNASTNE